MRLSFLAVSLLLTTALSGTSALGAQDDKPSATPLLQSDITGIESHEALMTHVKLPANASLPMHYHPTEEFMYVVAGEAILRIKDREDIVIKAGSSGKIPARTLHTAVTHTAPAEVVVFRVHPKGQPVRILPNSEQ